MLTSKLKIDDCLVLKPNIFFDDRGSFHEWFKASNLDKVMPERFSVKQANCSVSKKGVIRGIHYAKNPPGQAKFVTCFTGSIFDVVVDLRPSSPTFGVWDSVIIDSSDPVAVAIPSGVGHGFMALEESTTVVYLCDQEYNPKNEFELNPFDPTIGIDWPTQANRIISNKDLNAPNFYELNF